MVEDSGSEGNGENGSGSGREVVVWMVIVGGCLQSCLLCSCLMVWSGTAVMAYDGAGTAGSKRQRKAAPRFVFDEYCRTVWRASEKFCLV